MAKFAVILPAAGRSSRFHDKSYKKPFAPLANKAVWLHSADRFLNRDDVVQTILVIAPEDRDRFQLKFAANIAILGIEVIDGGAERADSVAAALARVKPRGRFRLCPRRRPALFDRRLDRRDLRRRREDRRRHLRHSGGRHAQTRRRRSQDRRDRFAREALGGRRPHRSSAANCCWTPTPNAAIFGPPTTPSWSSGSDIRSRVGARLADQHEDRHEGRPAAGRARPEGSAQAQARRAGASVRR